MGINGQKYSSDVIIVGSGPAGSTAAYFLASNGFTVTVFEKENIPRYKPCGGGIVGRIKELLPFELDDVIENYCSQAEVYDKGSGKHFFSSRSVPFIMMTMRQNFDSYIIYKAVEQGAVVRNNCMVRNIVSLDDGVEVNTDNGKYFSKFVIAADGASGRISKQLGLNKNIARLPALEYEIYTDDKTHSAFLNKARFDFGLPDSGYGWVFPKKDHLSIGVVSMSEVHVDLNQAFNEYINLLNIKVINKSDRHGYFITLANSKTNFCYKRILLTGDSAGFADPLTGEGISSAILSGRLAAESIINGNLDAEQVILTYKKSISRSIIKEHYYAGLIAHFVYNFPAVRTFLFKYYGQRLTEVIINIFSGKRKYSTLLRSPAFYFKLLFYFVINKRRDQLKQPTPHVTAGNLQGH